MSADVSAGDTAWVLTSAALVMVMLPGLALFYGGLVRRSSSLNTLMMTVAALGIVGVQWVVAGYSLAFAPGTPWVGGLAWLGFAHVGAGVNAAYAPGIPHLAFAAFQAMFAVITVALISGAVVERMRFSMYLAFAAAWTTIVYDPLAHWVWGAGGWLHSLGVLDFAGGTVVHVSAGTSALVAAAVLGKRRDLGKAALVPHNVPLTLLGAGLLWFGWFGFNAGSALAASGVAANAFVTTNTAAAAALTVWMLVDRARTGRSTAVGAATGAVVGLVAITPAAGYVTPLAAIAIGALGAAASYAVMQFRARTGIDDALDVFACHGVAGIAGALLTGVFATTAVNPAGSEGLLGGHPAQLGVQALGVSAAIIVSGGGTAAILLALKALGSLRVTLANEIAGIDVSEHGEQAYHGGDLDEALGSDAAIGGSVLIAASEMADGERRLAGAALA